MLLPVQKPLGSLTLYLPELGLQVYPTMSGFYVGARDLNLGSQTCAASTSLTKLFLLPLLSVFVPVLETNSESA